MLGLGDRNLKIIREALGVQVLAREGRVQVSGDRSAVAAARDVLERLALAAERQEHMTRQQVLDLVSAANTGRSERDRQRGERWTPTSRHTHTEEETFGDPIDSGPAWDQHLDVYVGGQAVRAKTANQQAYLDSVRDHDLVFGIGPAGTGKTYLAVAAAVHMLKHERAKKVILVRPAVEAGERLGFLPGDMQQKVNPYLRPLFDALEDMMDYGTLKRFLLSDVVEVVPLAYMRGRTLNRAVILLDEAQNTTRGQMQMFLTRMGHGSKMIVTGDTTQIDLPDASESGLIDAVRRLRRVPGVGFCTMDRQDIVRHRLVQRIVEAYGDKTPKAEEAAQTREVAELLAVRPPDFGERPAPTASSATDESDGAPITNGLSTPTARA
ncbi:MAG: PhoH family protein [Phycisphaerales bacterium]|nr:PhoH family protein [Phycisphaerales bacterium]